MTARTRVALTVVLAAAALAGCAEKEQTASGIKSDAPAWKGTGMPYATHTWKQGDKASWEQNLKTRNQKQNEYARIQ